ncbi:MAG: SoxR reducing system RseC family protein, partial [Bacteroides sp.]|nr:SoxR reducing system RseC family protein [Bacteroides sp.]
MSDIIEHRGIVESTNGSCVVVRIEQTSACAACAAKGHCSSADRKEKLIEVSVPSHSYKKGDSVV